MKKKLLFAVLILVVLAGLVYAGIRISRRGTDIIGVTTLTPKNVVIMNSKSGKEFVSGSGQITVGDNELIHLEYALDAGSFDIALNAGDGSLSVFQTADMANLPAEGEVFGKSGVTGKGSLDFDVTGGEYVVYFLIHDTVGTAKVSAKAK